MADLPTPEEMKELTDALGKVTRLIPHAFALHFGSGAQSVEAAMAFNGEGLDPHDASAKMIDCMVRHGSKA